MRKNEETEENEGKQKIIETQSVCTTQNKKLLYALLALNR